MQNNTAFKVDKLSFAYNETTPVLRELSFEIPSGKITTLMGSNGCGKSTLFNILTKNLKPVFGDIYCKNVNINDISLREFAQNVAIVHQYNTAPADLMVYQLVRYGRTPYKDLLKGKMGKEDDERKVLRAMKITGIEHLQNRTVESLSGGQRQRAFIAMALAQNTDILLLDEPTTYLDIRYQLQILRLVKMLNAKLGITIVMVLHDINQAIKYSDEIIALSRRGTILAQGNPAEIMDKDLIKKMYGIDLEIVSIQDEPFVITV